MIANPVQFRSHLFCTWGAEGAAALKISEMTIFQSQAFLVEGAGGKVIESVKSSNPCTDLGRLLTSIFKAQLEQGTHSSPASFTVFSTTLKTGIWKKL
jgi:hypothetical protein